MESFVNFVVYRPVWSVSELQRVQVCSDDGPELWQYKAFKGHHDYRGQGDRSVVVKSCGPSFFQDRDNGGGFEASSDVARLQRDVKDISEHWGQLIGAVLQGERGDRVRVNRTTEWGLFFKGPSCSGGLGGSVMGGKGSESK